MATFSIIRQKSSYVLIIYKNYLHICSTFTPQFSLKKRHTITILSICPFYVNSQFS